MIENLQALHFLRPWWLLAILPALALTLLWARRRWSGSPWRNALAPELLAVLLERQESASRRCTPWVIGLGLSLGALGLAGPTWERQPQPVEQKGDGLVILFDLSLSMYAEDLSPSRLTRAAHKITDVLRRRSEGFTALVAYAGDAHIVAPLTDDVRTIENLLTSLNPAMMPVLGSNTGSALDLAHNLFDNARMAEGRMLLVTDGIDQVSAVADRCSSHRPLSILGVGTSADALIPLDLMNQPGQHLRTESGELVRTPLDASRLAAVAQLCRGRYRNIEVGDGDIVELLHTSLPTATENIKVDREFDAWADMGYWGALALLPVLLVGFRRGLLVCLTLGLMASLPAPQAFAGVWEDLWLGRDQQAQQALEQGQPDIAAQLFENSQWRAAAKYHSQDYEGAAKDWRDPVAASSSHYNLGNALAHLGDYTNALAAYEEVLKAEPNHEDAVFNKALVGRLLAQQQAEQSADGNQGGQGNEHPQNSQGRDGANQAPSPASPNGEEQQAGVGAEQDDQDRQQLQPQEGAEDAGQTAELSAAGGDSRNEEAEAMEQWLRRVPDDPGGLLRRKFRYETNQRLRRGEYRSREQEKIW